MPAARRFPSWRGFAAAALGALSLSQMAGDWLELRVLKGIGAASVLAPLPKVFSDVRGLETFASEFTFEVEEPGAAAVREIPITPQLYSQLAGPYNRRNVYGAALAYAPRLPEKLWQSVFCFGLRPGGPLRTELGLPAAADARLRVRIRTRTRGRADRWLLAAPCLP